MQHIRINVQRRKKTFRDQKINDGMSKCVIDRIKETKTKKANLHIAQKNFS